VRNDEQQPPQGPPPPRKKQFSQPLSWSYEEPRPEPPQPYQAWSYDEGPQPPSRPAGPPSGNLPNNVYPYPYSPSSYAPSSGLQNGPAPQLPRDQEPYNADLTMDMGNSLGYSQSIQHHSISMPQPTQGLRRLRWENRLRQLSAERTRRRQSRMGQVDPSLIPRVGLPGRPENRNAPLSGPLRGPGNLPARSSTNPYAVSPYAPGGLPQQGGARSNSATHMPDAGLQAAAAPAQDTAMIQRAKVARASSVISAAFMLSSILGLVQTFLFTFIFGRSLAGDAYLQAYFIPNLIFTVVAGGALSSAFIPVFTSYAVKENDERTAWHIASSSLNISVVGMIVFSIIAFVLAPAIVPLYSRPEEFSLIVPLTRIMLIQAVVLGSGVIVGAVLNTKQDFTRTALGAVLYNVGLILGLIPGFLMTLFSRSSSPADVVVYVATWGVVLGAILQVGVQIPGLVKVNMRYSFVFDWRHPGVRQIGLQMVPRVINAVMLSFSTGVDRYLLSLLSGGLINAYTQAFSILLLPVSLFGSAVSTASFPTLASYAARGRFERVRSIIMETLRGILFLTIPSGVGLVVLSFPIAQALLEHGNFDLKATQLASVVLLFFALGLPALAAVEILTRSFYALQDSKTPVAISVAQFVLKIVLSLILVRIASFNIEWGMGALAFSTSVASIAEAVALFYLLSQRIGGFDLQAFRDFVAHALLASGAMAVVLLVVQAILNHMIDTTSMPRLLFSGILLALVKLLIELGFGSLAFLITARLLKMEEMNSGLVRRVLNLLRIPWL